MQPERLGQLGQLAQRVKPERRVKLEPLVQRVKPEQPATQEPLEQRVIREPRARPDQMVSMATRFLAESERQAISSEPTATTM